jgi:D-glycero-beta-D-manno-heptose 1-phosphate adenylyltransferase
MKSDKQEIVVLATGVFDLLHVEHIRFLAAAKQQGDRLIVGVETDRRVQTLKGPGRPLHSQLVRLEQVQAVKFVDQAFLLPEIFDTYDDWFALMEDIRPDIYAVSAHTSHIDTKKQICDALGVKLLVVRPHDPSVSTTLLLEKAKRIE